MNIAFFSTRSYDKTYFKEANKDFQYTLRFFEVPLNMDTIQLAEGSKCICAFVNDQLDSEVLHTLKKMEVDLIALRCAGFNNVDLTAAKALDLRVVRVPAYSPYAVAEHAVAMILTLNRKTHKAYNRIREQNFSLERLEGFDLYGKTVGVIGTGKIGSAFCNIMLGFGCKLLAADKYPSEALQKAGVKYVDTHRIFKEADIISLHCPLNQETHYLIDDEAIHKMKDGIMIINTSRGGLVDTQAVIRGLKHGKIGYLGIDVYEQEEHLFFQDLSETLIPDEVISRLMTFPNVLITAHQAFFTKNALDQIARTTLGNVKQYVQGNPLDNQISLP